VKSRDQKFPLWAADATAIYAPVEPANVIKADMGWSGGLGGASRVGHWVIRLVRARMDWVIPCG
jgi:hypothetical protein